MRLSTGLLQPRFSVDTITLTTQAFSDIERALASFASKMSEIAATAILADARASLTGWDPSTSVAGS